MTTQTYNGQNAHGLARTLLAIMAVLAGLTTFIGVIAFIGGVGSHNTNWLLSGLGLILISIIFYTSVRWAIRKATGTLVTLQSPMAY